MNLIIIILKLFQHSWNQHQLCTEHNCSPIQLWTLGLLEEMQRSNCAAVMVIPMMIQVMMVLMMMVLMIVALPMMFKN